MRDTNLMQQALGLTPPWTVVRSDFDTEAGRLDVEIDFTPGSPLRLPQLRRGGLPGLRYPTQDLAPPQLLPAPSLSACLRAARALRNLWHQAGQCAVGKAG